MDVTIFYGRFSYFKKLELIKWIMLILGISKFLFNSLGIWFWNLCSFFFKCVGGTYMCGCFIPRITHHIFLFTLVILVYKIKGIKFDFTSTHTILTPVISNFRSVFYSYFLPTAAHCHEIWTKRCRIFLCIFWIMWKVCPRLSTYSNAHAKV